jgi:SPP1 family predicted phage head-tail adaptor
LASRIGKLRHRITFQEDTGTQDSGGFRTESWGNLATVPTVSASVEPLSAGELFQAGQTRVEATHKIVIRERADLTSNMRITATIRGNSRTFYIRGIRTLEERDATYTEIMAYERPSE